MAKRESLHRRSSKYSKGSVGSGVLDPNTDVLDDEHPYWWKNLENNTIARPSTNTTAFNQTSRRLNSNSSIGSSEVDDGWWKILEGTTRSSRSPLSNKSRLKEGAMDGITTMSESDEETVVAKRKPQLQIKSRTIQTNAFLNALNSSKDQILLKSNSTTQRNTSQYESPTANKISSDSEHLNKSEELSSSPNRNSGNIAKLKPKIFSKKQARRKKNLLTELLNKDKEEESSKRKSSGMSSTTAILLPLETKLPVTDNSSVIASADLSKFPTLLETESDFSNLIPKASSTQLGSSVLSQQDSNSSDIDNVVPKPKLKLLKRCDKDPKQNPFENILMEEQLNPDKNIDQSVCKTVVTGTDHDHETTEKEHIPSNVLEQNKPVDVKVPGIIDTAGNSDSLDPSSDTSHTSSEFRRCTKLKSRFLMKPQRSPRKNLFQGIFEGNESSDTEDLSKNSKKSNLTTENPKNLQVLRSCSNSNTDTEEVVLKVSNGSEASDVDVIGNILEKAPSSPEGNEVVGNAIEDTNAKDSVSNTMKRSNSNVNWKAVSSSQDEVKLKERDKNASLGRPAQLIMNDSDEADDKDVFEEIPASNPVSTNFERIRTEIVAKTLNEELNDGTLNPEETSITKQSQILKRSRGRPLTNEEIDRDVEKKNSIEFENNALSSADELTDTDGVAMNTEARALDESQKRSISRRESKRLTESWIQSSSTVNSKKATAEQNENTSPRRTRSFERLERKSVSRDTNVAEMEDAVRTPSRSHSKRLSQAREIDLEADNITPRQSGRFNEVEHKSTSRVAGEIESAQMSNRQSRNTLRMQKQTESFWEVEDISLRRSKKVDTIERKSGSREVEDTSSRQSKRHDATNKRSTLWNANDADTEGVQTPTKWNRSTNKVPEQEVSDSMRRSLRIASEVEYAKENERTENIEQQQSRGFSVSERKTRLLFTGEPETKVESPSRRRTRSMSQARDQTVSTIFANEKESSKRTNKSCTFRKLSFLMSDSETEESSSKKQNETTSQELARRIVIPENVENVTPRRSNRSSRIKESSQITRESEKGISPSKKQRHDTSQLKEQTVSVSANEEKLRETEDITSRRSNRSNVVKRLRVTSESEMEEAEPPSKRQSRSTSQAQKHKVSTTTTEKKAIDAENTTRSIKRKSLLPLVSNNDSETDNFTETDPKEESGVSKRSVSRTTSGSETKNSFVKTTSKVRSTGRKRSVPKKNVRTTSLRRRKRLISTSTDHSEEMTEIGELEKTEDANEHGQSPDAKEVDAERIFDTMQSEPISCSTPFKRSTLRAPSESKTVEQTQKKSLTELEEQTVIGPANEVEDEIEQKETSDRNKWRTLTPVVVRLEREGRADPKLTVEEKQSSLAKNDNESATRTEKEKDNETRLGKGNVNETSRDVSSNRIDSDGKKNTNVLRFVFSASQSPGIVKRKASDKSAVLAKAKSLATSSSTPKGQRNIKDFFQTDRLEEPASQTLSDSQKMLEIRKKLQQMMEQDVAKTRTDKNDIVKELSRDEREKKKKKSEKNLKSTQQQRNSAKKEVNKAFIVNGVVYKKPRLPRPKHWITDRLYRYLWKQMESKYKMETRVTSERFVRRLSEITSIIKKRTSYSHYKVELRALTMEMARLGIVRTLHDFYNFCYDFLPYDLRVKMVPMLLPGNRKNIPLNANKLHVPILP